MRATFRERLKNIDYRKEKEDKVTEKAVALIEKYGYKKIAVYLSFGTELSTDNLIKALFEKNKYVYAPVVTDDFNLVFTRIYPDTEYFINSFGIREPKISEPETDFDAIFVPLLAFDGDGRRLGRGKGCYDKFLSTSRAKKIGLAFAEQKVETVPTEETDVKLDRVIYF